MNLWRKLPEMPRRKDPGKLDHARDGAGVSASADASPGRKGWRGHDILLRLHPTLVSTITGLVLLTALSIGGTAALLTLYDTRAEI